MATYTSRLFATKPASSENVSITVLNDNFDLFDASVGTTVASAAAQPASAFSGRMWYETDTRELKINTAASASTAAVWSSGSSVKVWEPGLNLAGGTGGAAASDGTTDVTSVMQVKIDLLNAAGGGTLFIPERTYRVAMRPRLAILPTICATGVAHCRDGGRLRLLLSTHCFVHGWRWDGPSGNCLRVCQHRCRSGSDRPWVWLHLSTHRRLFGWQRDRRRRGRASVVPHLLHP